ACSLRRLRRAAFPPRFQVSLKTATHVRRRFSQRRSNLVGEERLSRGCGEARCLNRRRFIVVSERLEKRRKIAFRRRDDALRVLAWASEAAIAVVVEHDGARRA